MAGIDVKTDATNLAKGLQMTCIDGVGTLVNECASACLKSSLNEDGFNGTSCKNTDSGIPGHKCQSAMNKVGLTQDKVNELITNMKSRSTERIKQKD